MTGEYLTGWPGSLMPAREMLQVTTSSSSMVREVVLGPKPTRAESTVEVEADVAMEHEQHCWHIVPQ